MKNYKQKIMTLEERVNELSLREKILASFTGMVFLVIFFSEHIMQAQEKQIKDIEKKIILAENELKTYQQETKKLKFEYNENYSLLRKKSMAADKKISQLLSKSDFKNPTPQLVVDLLDQTRPLELISFESLEERTLKDMSFFTENVYQINFYGQYPEIIKFLHKLKSASNLIRWEKFDYQTQNFPYAKANLILSTLNYSSNDLSTDQEPANEKD